MMWSSSRRCGPCGLAVCRHSFFFSMFFYDGQSGREGEKETQGKEKGMCYGLGNEGHDMN